MKSIRRSFSMILIIAVIAPALLAQQTEKRILVQEE